VRRIVVPAAVVLALAAGAVVAVVVLTGTRRGTSPSGPIVPPPPGVLTLAAQDVRDAVAVAVRPAGSQTELTASIVGPDGNGVNGLPVRIDGVAGVACGSGCYRALVPGRPRAVRVDAGAGTVTFPLHTVPGPAIAIVARAAAKLRGSASTVYRERLSSGPGHTITTLWKEQAPNRLSYVIDGGAAGIVIGSKRWDRDDPDGRWVASPQFPLTLPALPWTGPLTNFRILDADDSGWTVAFLDRSTPAWFRVRIDRSTGRLRSVAMTATAHFMRDTYLSYGEKLEIEPPG